MKPKEIERLLKAIANAVIESIQNELITYGLKDSNIIKNTTYKITEYTIDIEIPFYYVFIESGRKPLTKKVPIDILLKWMKRKNISTENNRVWAIQQSIYKNGIKARPFIDKAIANSEQQIEVLLRLDFDELINERLERILKA